MSYIQDEASAPDDSITESGPISLAPDGYDPSRLFQREKIDYELPAQWQLPGSDDRDGYPQSMNVDYDVDPIPNIKCAAYKDCGRLAGLCGFAEDLDANAAALEAAGNFDQAAPMRAQAAAYRAGQAGQAIAITSAMERAMPGGGGFPIGSAPSVVSAGGPDFGDILTSIFTGVGNAAKGVASAMQNSKTPTGAPIYLPTPDVRKSEGIPPWALAGGLALLAWIALK